MAAVGAWIVNELFVYSEDINSIPGYSKHREFGEMTTKAFGRNLFSRTVFKAFKNRRKWFRLSPDLTNFYGFKLLLDRSCTSHRRSNKVTR